MSGWVVLVALAALLAAGLWVAIRPSRTVTELIAAALLAAFAGYASQGSPAMPGSPTKPRANQPQVANIFAEERGRWLETVGVDAQALDAADGLIAGGDPAYAVGILRAGLAQRPRSATLWVGLGNALVHYADGAVTPPARHAFQRAAILAPNSPAPGYFLGLTLAQSGDLESARQIWRGLLAAAPRDAPWRRDVTDKLEAVSRAIDLR